LKPLITLLDTNACTRLGLLYYERAVDQWILRARSSGRTASAAEAQGRKDQGGKRRGSGYRRSSGPTASAASLQGREDVAARGKFGPAASSASLQGREDEGGEGGNGRGLRDERSRYERSRYERSFQDHKDNDDHEKEKERKREKEARSNMEGFFNMVRSSVGFEQDQDYEPRGDVQPAYPRSEKRGAGSRQVLLHREPSNLNPNPSISPPPEISRPCYPGALMSFRSRARAVSLSLAVLFAFLMLCINALTPVCVEYLSVPILFAL